MAMNRAAYDASEGSTALEIKDAPMPTAGHGDIVIKPRAIAMNPADYAIQTMGTKLFPWLTYPAVLGEDVAGVIHSVGPDVTTFKPGDRVLAMVSGVFAPGDNMNQPARGAFQEYVLGRAELCSKIPEDLSFEKASVFPLCLVTAAAGLYPSTQLGLQHPSVPPKPTGKTLLVWGASSSVGCNAAQLAIASGYEVIATASAKNHELVKRLGASQVFDYNSPTVTVDVAAAFKGKESAGAIACAMNTLDPAMEAIKNIDGGKKFVASAWRVPEGTEGAKFIDTSDVKANGDLTATLFHEFLPKALERGSFIPAPEPYVIGHGLESTQAAMDHLKKGVSAAKVVVTI